MAQYDKKGLSAIEKALITLDDGASQEVNANINPDSYSIDFDSKW